MGNDFKRRTCPLKACQRNSLRWCRRLHRPIDWNRCLIRFEIRRTRSSFLYGLKSDERLKRSENILEVCMRLGGKEKNHFIDTPQKLHFAGWLLPKKPDEYSLDSIPSIRRNKIICRCFEMIGLIERNGSGLKKIYNIYKKLKFKEPQLNDQHDYFLITLYDMLGEKNNSVIINGKYDEAILAFCNGVSHRILSHARLPVPPRRHSAYFSLSNLSRNSLVSLMNRSTFELSSHFFFAAS